MDRLRMALALMAAALHLAGCATMLEGTGQSVAITTDPAGAQCSIDRAGQRVGQVTSTPGSIRLDKGKNDLSVTCVREGYQPATITQSPKFQGTTFGNILIGGVVGVVVDAASGANFAYPDEIKLTLAGVGTAAGVPIAMQQTPPTGAVPPPEGAAVSPAAASNRPEKPTLPEAPVATVPITLVSSAQPAVAPTQPTVTGSPTGSPAPSVRRELGVRAEQISTKLATSLHLDPRRGVIILEVQSNGVAADAGLHVGDAILELGGAPIADMTDMLNALSAVPAGSVVPVAIWREHQSQAAVLRF
jgi:hypothetical protein